MVQSGKRGNYIGLVNKAPDVGYRVIVILAGIHDSLRAQTQIRVDNGFLGFDTQTAIGLMRDGQRVGVGRIRKDPSGLSLTSGALNGDFKSTMPNMALGGDQPVVMVVKKNGPILKSLVRWMGAQGDRVRVRSYVLPHLSRLTDAARERAGGPRGITGMQGFYVYRAERMLVAGNWLGMARQHEDTKLARVLVDITNADDEAWQIDIKKSTARPPAGVRGDLDTLARQAQAASRQVYRHRGVNAGGVRTAPTEPVWDEMVRQGKRFYQINRKHPAVDVLISGDGTDRTRVEAVLRLIEETVPVARIYSGIADGTSEPPEPLEGEADAKVMDMMQAVYQSLCSRSGPASAADTLAMMDPFSRYPALVERFLKNNTAAPKA